MTAYYPSQGSYSHHGHHHHGQPVVYSTSQGYGQPMVGSTEYYQPGGVMYAPSSSSRRHHRHHNDRMPQVASVAAPVILQPSSHGGHHYHNHYSFGERLRRFFGLAPKTGVRYKSDRGSWGFLGYSRRQRYTDARTGAEVDRQGRPVYRV